MISKHLFTKITSTGHHGRAPSSPETDLQFSEDVEHYLNKLPQDVMSDPVNLTPKNQMKRGLKSRHAQMIALGGSIGTGLFVGSGQALARGGPLFLLLAFIIISTLVYCVTTAIVEVASYIPSSGSSMNMLAYRYVSRSLGFAMGWLYFYSLGILIPYEITAASLVIDYWHVSVHPSVWICIIIFAIVALNLLPVQFYGETEFWFASTKVIMIFGLLILSVVLFFGGGPDHKRLGFHYWKEIGPIKTYLEPGSLGYFLAFMSTLVMASFPFAFASEQMVVTAGEMVNPRRNLPVAARRFFYRLVVFYISSVFAVGVICPSDSPLLTSGGIGAGASPFTVGIMRAGIRGLDSVINAGIIVSAWSAGNSFLYLSSRSLYSLAKAGHAPQIFTRCAKSGIPIYAVCASSLFTGLAFLNIRSSSAIIFNWLISLTNTSAYISWICGCIVFLRFRAACRANNVTLKDLPYHSKIQPYGAWVALVGFTILCLVNGFYVFWPQNWSTSAFLTAYIGLPCFLTIYFVHRFTNRKVESWVRPVDEVDLKTDLDEVISDEKYYANLHENTYKKKGTIHSVARFFQKIFN